MVLWEKKKMEKDNSDCPSIQSWNAGCSRCRGSQEEAVSPLAFSLFSTHV